MNDTFTRRSIVSTSLARFLSFLHKVNSESLANIDKENYHFQVADSLNSTFEQIKSNLELKKRNLLISCKDRLTKNRSDVYNEEENSLSLVPTNAFKINFTINSNQFNAINLESSSPIKSKFDQSSSFKSNNTFESSNSLNGSNSSTFNLVSIQQSVDSGFSTFKLSNPNIHKSLNLNIKKDEQAFISSLLYFLNLKNDNELTDNNSFTPNCRTDLPEMIALSLIKLFSEREPSFKIDPNELDCWLIGEDEVPQKLLPIPNNMQFLSQHFDRTLLKELGENKIDFMKQINPSESIEIKTNSTLVNRSKNDNLIDNQTINDKQIKNESELLENSDFLINNDLTSKLILNTEHNEMQKLNSLFYSGKFFNFSSLNNSTGVKCRGSDFWSPPRAMIHVIIHPSPKRQELIAKQNYRCCGCGLQVEQDIPRMLYCYYTGKYFCKYGCHSSTKTIIPAYVINKWSFKLYPVSNFAFQVIQNNYTKPLFNIQDLNPKLFTKVKQFQNLHNFRGQLLKLKDYIVTCKKSGNLLVDYLMFEPKHFIESSKDLIYSLEDLVDIKRDCKTLERCFDLVNKSIKHIKNCSYCLAKGFICELCSSGNQITRQVHRFMTTINNRVMVDILFPFESGRVKQCESCYACYHLNCFANNNFRCVKCVRIERRKSNAKEVSTEVPI